MALEVSSSPLVLVFISILTLPTLVFGGDLSALKVPHYGDGSNLAFWEGVIEKKYEYAGYDGWYNNRAHPDWGAADMPMLRRLPAAYSDGVYEPSGANRPSPIAISEAVMSGPTGKRSERDRTAFLVFFGQQVVEEILDAQRPGCPPEYFNISIPTNHHLNPDNLSNWMMPLQRSRYDMSSTGFSPNTPREQLNEITPWIDGGLMYGVGKAWADTLRSFSSGKLKSTLDSTEEVDSKYSTKDFPAVNGVRLPMANPPPPIDHYLKPVNRFWRLGNPRGNENPFLLTFGVMWFRLHNRIAEIIGEKVYAAYQDPTVRSRFNFDTSYSEDEFFRHYDEKIFNEARKWVVAVHQKVVTYDWLPSWLQTKESGVAYQLPRYTGYKPYVHPQIMHVFQSAAMRFGHTLVPPGVYRRRRKAGASSECEFVQNGEHDRGEGKQALRTCNVYWNPQEPIDDYDIDELILGMSSQVTEREDTIITPDLRGFVFGGLDFSRRDLMAINIQRGRDHGLPDYNTARREFGLKEIRDWTEINEQKCGTSELLENSTDCEMIRGLREVYGYSLDDIDIWPGGLSETTGDGPGELFRTVIEDQFVRIRDGDRFWWENKLNGLFDKDQMTAINGTTIRQIILAVTDIEDSELSSNPFFHKTASQKCNITMNRAANEGFNVTDMVCNDADNCDAIRQELSNANPEMSEFDLNRFADCNVMNEFSNDPCPAPAVIDGSNRAMVSECTALKGFDYFTGSEVSYILTFVGIGLFAVGCVVILIICARRRQSNMKDQRRKQRAESNRNSTDPNMHIVSEWQGYKEGTRSVKVKHDAEKRQMLVYADGGRMPIRTIDCRNTSSVHILQSMDRDANFVCVSVKGDYDLVLVFDDLRSQTTFLNSNKDFFNVLGISRTTMMSTEKSIMKGAVTKAKRKLLLDKFFRAVFKRAFRISDGYSENLDAEETDAVTSCELTIYEFADVLSMKPNSVFIKNMFDLIDKDRNGLVSFREFLDVIVIFAKGGAQEKTRLLFDMYDVHGAGVLSRQEFRMMLTSLMDLANTSVEEKDINQVIDMMFREAGIQEKPQITFDDFSRILRDHEQYLDCAQLNFGVDQPPPQANTKARAETVINPSRDNAPSRARKTIIKAYHDSNADRATKRQSVVEVKLKPSGAPNPSHGPIYTELTRVANYMENYRRHIFWVLLYTLVAIFVFLERAYYFSVEREHASLRRIAGYGVSVTRGAASGMMFTYCSLLLTMSRNLITALRETFFNQFIPFDSAIWFHKYVAYLALIFTGIHILGHTVNFYHISTQTPGDLTCLFRNFYRSTHVLPTFHYWCWGTITGITGVLLTLCIIVIYVYAQQYARRNLFRAFWITHQLFYAVFIMMVLHGAGILVQSPLLYTFLIGPLVIFTLDKLVSASRNKTEISIVKAELLPSDVTGLTFKKPSGFEYRSGQWVRIACLDLGAHEYHPFTLTSAPHEDNLSLHIRAVGPWTTNIRNQCDPNFRKDKPYPKLYLDGPFGEGHQDWYRYDVAVLVGGGIGVTPFASILKDIVQKASIGSKFSCKKVYFLWVTRSQKQYEWLVDIIREVEEKDSKDFVSVHIFVTQFYQKFDFRTTLLYICERYFQRVSNKSLFTGLRSITHFGRPDFHTFLQSLKDEHPGVSKIGVFSCGPPPMTRNVEDACAGLNKDRIDTDQAAFIHHYENF